MKKVLIYLSIFIISLYCLPIFTAQRSRALSRQSSSLLKSYKRTSPIILPSCGTQSSVPFRRSFFSLKESDKKETIPSFDPLIFWNYKSQDEQQKYLFEALAQKLQGKQSKILRYDDAEAVIELIAEKNMINEKSKEGKTPLMIAIENSVHLSKEQQRKIIKELGKQGAVLNDVQALVLAIKEKNLGALETLQPHFRMRDLYPEFKTLLNEFATTKSRVNRFQQQPTLRKIFEDHLAVVKKELEILDKPIKPVFAEAQEFHNDKEQDVLYEIHSPSQLYLLEKKSQVRLVDY